MSMGKVFDAFIEKRPVCVAARAILERLLSPEWLNGLFERTAVEGYTQELLFSDLVQLMGNVILGVNPSVNAAHRMMARANEITVSGAAVYSKLSRVEAVVSAALVRESAAQAAAVIDALHAKLPPWLPGYRVRLLDGNHLSATEHHIKELRGIWDAPLPGKVLVVVDQERMLAEEVFLTEDGHAQERRLSSDILQAVKERDLWIADRNFCTLKLLLGILRQGGFFLFRQHSKLKGELVGQRRKVGKSETGMVYEQTIRLLDPVSGEEFLFRRITVELKTPTRDGDRELHLLSNLPETAADALELAALYRKRWTIETMFQEMSATLNCEIDALGYPPAALFCFCLGLLAYNATSVLKASLRSVHGAEAVQKTVSGYYLSLEVTGPYEGMMIAIPAEHWAKFRTMPVEKFAETLRDIIGNACLAHYRKSTRGPKKPPPEKNEYKNGGHVSTYKLLQARKRPC